MTNAQWDKVVSVEIIEETDYPFEYVYDFSVREIETFLLTNGLIVHNTLNTFHQSGVSSGCHINQGVPRIREIISVSRSIRTPSVKIEMPDSVKFHKPAVKELLHSIQLVKFDYVVKESCIFYENNETKNLIPYAEFMQNFINTYAQLHEIDLTKQLSPWILCFKINTAHLVAKQCCMFDLHAFLIEWFTNEKINAFVCFTDDMADEQLLFIRLKHKNIDLKFDVNDPKTLFEDNSNDNIDPDIQYVTNEDYAILKSIEQSLMHKAVIQGIDRIEGANISETNVNVLNDRGEVEYKKAYVIETKGTNLLHILKLQLVNALKTRSNDLHEINQCFGIEAARTALKEEIYQVLNQSGVTVGVAHVDLLADVMTLNGTLISVSRYGISKIDNNVMQRASLEEPDDHFTRAAAHNSIDPMRSTSANVAFGQICKFGTGLCELVFQPEKFNQV